MSGSGINSFPITNTILRRSKFLTGYLTSGEILVLYAHGAGLPINWNIEKTKELEKTDPARKVIFWFNSSKEISEEYAHWRNFDV